MKHTHPYLDLDIPQIQYLGLERGMHFAFLCWLHSQHPETTAHLLLPQVERRNPRCRWFGTRNESPAVLTLAFGPDTAPDKIPDMPTILLIRDVKDMMASRFERFDHDGIICHPKKLDIWVKYAKQALGDEDYLNGNCIPVVANKWFSSKPYRAGIIDLVNIKFNTGFVFTDKNINKVARPGGGSSFDKLDYDGRAQEMQVLNRWEQSEHQDLIEPLLTEEVLSLNKRLFGE